ncbi:hypothetical protein ACL02U_04220 [Streptomyces sp. MS06]|uniref:hypothetical protein n=1 Tax=Streptomyces sp. MS06 TaxID=3385974 RepID=UPI0039A27444
MRGRAGLSVALLLSTGLLFGCSKNECSGGSVCGGHNNVGRTESQSVGPASPSSTTEAPFTYTVSENDPWDACEGGLGRVYPKPPPALDAIAAHLDGRPGQTAAEAAEGRKKLATFDEQHHAITADLTIITLTLQGRSSHAVVINKVRPDVLGVKPTPAGSVRVQRVGSCGGTNESSFLVDLDKEKPELEFKEGQDATGRMRVKGFPVQVTDDDPEVLTIVAFTVSGVHSFGFTVDWTSDGRSGSTQVRGADDGPFSVASDIGGTQYDYSMQEGGFTSHTSRIDPADPLGDALPLAPS